MILLKLLEKKPIIIDSRTGEEKIDLTVPIISGDSAVSVGSYHKVTENEEMRPDLIGYNTFGDEGAFGYFLKANGISNPYSLKAGDFLFLPTYESITKVYQSPTNRRNPSAQPKSYRREIQEKISKVSPERIEYLNARNISDAARGTTGSVGNVGLPPNVLQPGQEGSRVIEGRLVFGPDIGQCRGTAKRPLSEAQLRARLIEKKIFKGV
jgi:hypothetical protein